MNNPLKFTDDNGEFFLLAIGIGALINVAIQASSGHIHSVGDFCLTAGIGALAGAAAAFGGGAAMSMLNGFGLNGTIAFGMAGASGTGFLGGMAVGATAGFAGGFVSGAGNAWANGSNFGAGFSVGLKDGGIGGLTGGVIGGGAAGFKAYRTGADFWSGKMPLPKFETPVLDASSCIKKPELSLPRSHIRAYSEGHVEVGELSSNARLRTVRPGYNINNAVTYMDENAASKSGGYCARAVRKGIEAGGISTVGRPGAAWKYVDFLPAKGFNAVDVSSGYIPLRGDIAVMSNFGKHVYGHIQMYDGISWVSDFVQRGFWPGSAYRLTKPSYTIFRW